MTKTNSSFSGPRYAEKPGGLAEHLSRPRPDTELPLTGDEWGVNPLQMVSDRKHAICKDCRHICVSVGRQPNFVKRSEDKGDFKLVWVECPKCGGRAVQNDYRVTWEREGWPSAFAYEHFHREQGMTRDEFEALREDVAEFVRTGRTGQGVEEPRPIGNKFGVPERLIK